MELCQYHFKNIFNIFFSWVVLLINSEIFIFFPTNLLFLVRYVTNIFYRFEAYIFIHFVFWWKEVTHFNEDSSVFHVNYFVFMCVVLRNLPYTWNHEVIHFHLKVFKISPFTYMFLIHLVWFLCMVWGRNPIYFFTYK